MSYDKHFPAYFMRHVLCPAKWQLAAALTVLTLCACANMEQTYPTNADHLTAGIFLDDNAPQHMVEALAPPRKLIDQGREFIQDNEGWRATAYNDAAGYCTIGYGHLIKKSRCDGTGPENPAFLKAISHQEGSDILWRDLWNAQRAVTLLVNQELDDYQFAALTDFVFNVGVLHFKNSTLRRVLNEGKFDEVGPQLKSWIKAGDHILPDLERRRSGEAKMFYFRTPQLLRALPPLPPIDIRTGESPDR